MNTRKRSLELLEHFLEENKGKIDEKSAFDAWIACQHYYEREVAEPLRTAYAALSNAMSEEMSKEIEAVRARVL